MTKVSITIFGGTGDLSYRKLLPALYNLYAQDELEDEFEIVAIGRRDYSQKDYKDIIDEWVRKFARIQIKEDVLTSFFNHIHYLKMDFTDLSQYERLNEHFKHSKYENNVVYLAVAPSFFKVIATGMEDVVNIEHPKIVLEKPFGANLEEAKLLNEELEKHFGKDNIYRIDHYLGKEMVRNILTIRETNPILYKVWTKDDIDHVEISALEEVGVETRGNYYDHVGALEDMVQNHLLQILTIVALDHPTGNIKEEQLKVMKALRPIDQTNVLDSVVFGQYDGYRNEQKVDPNSTTETYAALKLFVDNERWSGVPFYIRTGKKTSKREIEVRITFKKMKEDVKPNILVIKIQPVEGVYLEFNIKTPGGDGISQAKMEFCQNCNLIYRLNTPEAYERMLLACMQGNGSWFTNWEQIETSWKFILRLKEAAKAVGLPLHTYEVGSDGPFAYEEMK